MRRTRSRRDAPKRAGDGAYRTDAATLARRARYLVTCPAAFRIFLLFFFFACRGFGEIVFIDLQREYSGDKWRKGVSVDGTKD